MKKFSNVKGDEGFIQVWINLNYDIISVCRSEGEKDPLL